MSMTHYMELLTNPLNLVLFMAIPVILAEWIAISELYILFTNARSGFVVQSSRIAGLIAGVYFLGVFIYLMFNAVIPLTASGGWRGIVDMIAVGFYLAGVVPLGAIALLNAGFLARNADEREKRKLHAIFVGIFLVVAHVAMIAGMLDPTVTGWKPGAGAAMSGHNH